jgi:nicotinamidase-related amidase
MQFERITPASSIVMLVDHQTMTIDWVKSMPRSTTIASCRVLARLAHEFAMPLVLTTTMEEYVGATIPEIREVAGDAYDRRYRRGGELSCWDSRELRDGVKALGRNNLVLAGLTTDICLFWAAVDGQRLGYNVQVVADACGTMSSMGDTLTFDRLRSLGITVTVVNQVTTELVPNFGTSDGQKAQKIMSEEIISKLGSTAGAG